MKKRNGCLLVIAIVVVLGIIGYNYIYQDHDDMHEEKAQHVLDAQTFSNEFKIDPTTAETTYLNQIVELNGKVTNQYQWVVTLNNTVLCSLIDSTQTVPNQGADVTIKGRFIGYDNLLEQIKLNECIIINDN